jgi:xanthine/CO dehydrogenase XdhC/CoxF family maturation factor
MGLKIHAETPEEISVSILAEIIQIKQGTEQVKPA